MNQVFYLFPKLRGFEDLSACQKSHSSKLPHDVLAHAVVHRHVPLVVPGQGHGGLQQQLEVVRVHEGQVSGAVPGLGPQLLLVSGQITIVSLLNMNCTY